METMKLESNTVGSTPGQTMSRDLQGLRDIGLILFLGGGKYKLTQLFVDQWHLLV